MNESTWWISDNEYEIHHRRTTNSIHDSLTDILQEHLSAVVEVNWHDYIYDTHNISVEGEWLAHLCSWDGYENAGIEPCTCEPECDKSFDVVTIKHVPKKGQ